MVAPNESAKSSRRVLQPNERISEVLFGLIMVLTFTGSLSVAEARLGGIDRFTTVADAVDSFQEIGARPGV